METGLGNRFHTLISGIALGLVLNRSIIFDWTFSPVYKTNFSFLFESLIYINNENYFQKPNLKPFYCTSCFFRSPKKNFYELTQFSKENLKNYSEFILQTTHYFIPELYSNKNFQSILCNYFNFEEIHQILFKNFFKPISIISKKIEEFENYYLNYNIIGIQLRATELNSINSHSIESFFKCALQISNYYNNSKFFLATDNKNVRKLAKKILKNKLLLFKFEKNIQLHNSQLALLDIYLLSKCKEIILSPFSTFGHFSAAINGIKPHFIDKKYQYCFKDVSSSPKSHYWHGQTHFQNQPYQSSDTINQNDLLL